MKLIMKISVVVMSVIALVVAVLGSRQVFFHIDTDFQSNLVIWGLIVLLGIFVIAQVICLFVFPFNIKKIGFYLLHIGLVAVLVGSMIYYMAGIKIQGAYPVNEQGSSASAYHQLVKANPTKGENYVANFSSFRFGVTDFAVEYYEPVYDIYRVNEEGVAEEQLATDIEINSEGIYDFGEYGQKTVEDLVDDAGEYQVVNLTEDGSIVGNPRSSVKSYLGDVTIVNNETQESREDTISVNHPLRVNGWKIYLMSYDETQNAAAFIFKYDPGEYIVTVGMVMIIVGSFIACFVRPRQAAASGKNETKKPGSKKKAGDAK